MELQGEKGATKQASPTARAVAQAKETYLCPLVAARMPRVQVGFPLCRAGLHAAMSRKTASVAGKGLVGDEATQPFQAVMAGSPPASVPYHPSRGRRAADCEGDPAGSHVLARHDMVDTARELQRRLRARSGVFFRAPQRMAGGWAGRSRGWAGRRPWIFSHVTAEDG